MDASAKNFYDILAGDRRYVVPPYQRPYVWERDRQWEPMWDDIISTVDRLAKARRNAFRNDEKRSRADSGVSPHFLGAIVLEQQPTATGDIERRAVVDGQQRLTTIQLLIRGILDSLPERDHLPTRQPRASLQKMVRNDAEVTPDEDSLHKLWPRRAERDAFVDAMSSEASLELNNRFTAARQFFADKSAAWISAPDSETDAFYDGDPADGRVHLLCDVIKGLLKLVVINLENEDDAQVIFEVLNARNTPLTAADLVKNLLFMRAEADEPKDIEALYDTYWKPFDNDSWWTENVGTGHAARPRLDRFLGDFLIAQTGQTVNLGHLYGGVRTWILDKTMPVERVLSQLKHFGQAYRRLQLRDCADLSSNEIIALSNIHITRVVAADPLLLWLFTRTAEELPTGARERAVLTIEAFLVRRMATKWNTRGYTNVFAEVLNLTQQGSGPIDERLVAALASERHGYSWPSREDIIESFVSTRAYGAGGMNQARLRLLLGAVDRRLVKQNAKSENVDFQYGDLTIEHLMPQKWRTSWPVEGETPEARQIASIKRDNALHRIGNLTLLTKALNPSVSNGGWADKVREIEKHSLLPLNHKVIETQSWCEQDIEERGRWLADQVDTIWAAPKGVESGTEEIVDGPNDEELRQIHAELVTKTPEGSDSECLLPLDALDATLAELGLVDESAPESELARDVLKQFIGNGQAELVGADRIKILGMA